MVKVEDILANWKKQLVFYKHLGEKTFDQVSDSQLFEQSHPDNNSIAILVNHLWGNMLSRWTNFLTTDGEKESRERDLEFENVIATRAEMMAKWEEGWQCVFDALETINEKNFDTTVYIRNQGHTVLEAVNRQMCHYAYHVGQIVHMGKDFKQGQWQSLSIPKGQSKEYNAQKFAQEKGKSHFTEEFLNKKPDS